jgi:hypothetical protein
LLDHRAVAPGLDSSMSSGLSFNVRISSLNFFVQRKNECGKVSDQAVDGEAMTCLAHTQQTNKRAATTQHKKATTTDMRTKTERQPNRQAMSSIEHVSDTKLASNDTAKLLQYFVAFMLATLSCSGLLYLFSLVLFKIIT